MNRYSMRIRSDFDTPRTYLPWRNCHMALDRVLDLWQQGYKVVLDADIQGFFDNIPHSVIMAGLRRVVADGNILGLVERFLRAGVMENGVFKPTTVGTPQGGVSVFSPLAGQYCP